MPDLLNIIILALFGSVIALSGGVVFLFVKPLSKILTRYSVPFAAGVMLTTSLLGLLPEAMHAIGQTAFLITLISFLGAYIFENLICELHHHDHCQHHHHNHHKSVWLVIIGDTIHNAIDGVAIAASYLVNPGLGVITTASTFLHEVPHEIGDFGILLKAKWPKNKILLINFISALFTLVGALLVFYLVNNQVLIGYLLAIAAGMFLYLAASDFLPHADEDLSSSKALLALLAGVLIMYATFNLIPHSHEAQHEHEAEMEKMHQ